MSNKYPTKKGWHTPKQKYKISNWLEYKVASEIKEIVNSTNHEAWKRPFYPHHESGAGL